MKNFLMWFLESGIIFFFGISGLLIMGVSMIMCEPDGRSVVVELVSESGCLQIIPVITGFYGFLLACYFGWQFSRHTK